MATLGKIRSHGILLLIIVGGALLAFIIGDFINSSSSYFNQKKMKVAVVNGEEVPIESYMKNIDQLSNVYKIEFGNESLNEDVTEQVRQQVWETTIREMLLKKETKSLGMVVTREEFQDCTTGDNTHPLLTQRQVFANPQTGRFDKQILAQFLYAIENNESQLPEEYVDYWKFWEKTIKNSMLEEKYNVLLSKLLVANDVDAEVSLSFNANKADILYASQSYYTIADSLVTVTDKEIKARYNRDKEQYKKNTATCSINYVAFDIRPSDEDYQELEKWMNELVPDLKTTKEPQVLVNQESDSRFVDVALAKEDLDLAFRENAFTAGVGEILGPVFTNNTYKVARVLETGINRPDSVKLRHIFVATGDKNRNTVLADSLQNELAKGADFATLAKSYSQVQQTAVNGGEIGWLRELGLEKEMADKAFTTPAGKRFTIENNNGIQIFEVEEVGTKVAKVKLAVIERELTTSSKTQAKIYGEAKAFAGSCKNAEDLDKKAGEQGLTIIPEVNVDINAYKIGNVKNSRQVVRWAFESKNGTVSDVFECDGKFIVASVENINKDDYRSESEVKDAIKYTLLNEKKGDLIVSQLEGKSMQVLMAEGMPIDTLKNVTFDSQQLPRIGVEPMLAAKAAMGLDAKPVKGNNGVYFFKTLSLTPNQSQMNLEYEKQMLTSRLSYAINYLAMEALKDNANLKDNRSIAY